jgi:hypothetical protein
MFYERVSLKIQDLRSLTKAGIAEIKQTGVPNFNAAIQKKIRLEDSNAPSLLKISN